jgi:predicted nuclease of restriction endonuclease-like (RecB) superfamily
MKKSPGKMNEPELIKLEGTDLFERVVSILEQARSNVQRSINNNMVIAYWLIGREIVQQIQGGEERAEYGKKLIEKLSSRLIHKYGRGFSITNLRYFRTFYSTYSNRIPEIRHITCGELDESKRRHTQSGVLDDMSMAVDHSQQELGFSPSLGWSHYRTLMNVEHFNERLFYEIETEKEGWNVEQLKRQINTFLFARLLKSKNKAGVMALTREGNTIQTATDTIKNPYILDFLGIPDSAILHETKLEEAIINNLQSFLLELGKGFAFVGRQKRMQFDDSFFYIDLVFYNCILKCYLLIDLKIGELTHQDVGQIDGYVRMFDDKYLSEGDNPSIGLILCSKKNETIAKYSVLNNSKQLFASKYMLFLPTEEELQREIERERRLIEGSV